MSFSCSDFDFMFLWYPSRRRRQKNREQTKKYLISNNKNVVWGNFCCLLSVGLNEYDAGRRRESLITYSDWEISIESKSTRDWSSQSEQFVENKWKTTQHELALACLSSQVQRPAAKKSQQQPQSKFTSFKCAEWKINRSVWSWGKAKNLFQRFTSHFGIDYD